MLRRLVSGPLPFAALVLSFVLVAACRGYGTPATPPSGAGTPSPAATSPVAAQVARGGALYGASCARCHGAAGEGGPNAPALVGPGTLPMNPPAGRRLRTGTFPTAKEVGLFVKDQMPPGGPHLPPTDVAAVLAWLLQQNGITPPRPIDPSTAASIRLAR